MGFTFQDGLIGKKYLRDLEKHDCVYWSVCDDNGCKHAIKKNVNGFDNDVYTNMKQ